MPPTRSGWRWSRPPCTIIAVFLPVSFMGGLTGQYFIQFGLTVAAAVFFSLLVARLITPVIAAYTLKSARVADHSDGPIMAWYLRACSWCGSNRWKTVWRPAVFRALHRRVGAHPQVFVPEADFGASSTCSSSYRRACASRTPRRSRPRPTASSRANPRSPISSSRRRGRGRRGAHR